MSVSLIAAGKTQSNDTTRITTKKLYFDSQILPDHVLYPVLMAGDKVRLSLTPRHKKHLVQIEYAGKRLATAKALFGKGEHELAHSTLTKAQKYMLAASQTALSPSHKQPARQEVVDAIDSYLLEIAACRLEYASIEGHEIDRLVAELVVARDALRSAIASNSF